MFRSLNDWLVRAALVAASFVATSSLMLALGAVFDGASRQPWLRDSPQLRQAMATCSTRAPRDAQLDCARRVLAAAQAREALVAQLAAQQP